MRNIKIFFILMLIICTFASPQGHKGQARVRGFVYDEDGNPLDGVKVKLFSLRGQSGLETVTDSKGSWVAAWIRGGKWNIDFEKVGYEPKKISAEFFETKKNPDIEISLKKIEGPILTKELSGEVEKGNNLFGEERYEDAMEVYKKILEDFPDAYAVNKNIGNCYFQMGKYDLAGQYYQKVLEREPDDDEIKLAIGNCYANRGEDERALEWYNKIKFEEINDATVLYNIGTNFYNISQFAEALRYYKRAVEIQNNFLDGLYQLGLTHLTLGQYQEAIEVLESYLKHDPDSERALQVEGFIEFLKKKIEEKKTC